MNKEEGNEANLNAKHEDWPRSQETSAKAKGKFNAWLNGFGRSGFGIKQAKAWNVLRATYQRVKASLL